MSTAELSLSEDAGRTGSPRRSATCRRSASARAVSALRAFARETGRDWSLPAETEDALLIIVSELTANVHLHSGSADVLLRLLDEEASIRIEVSDRGRWRPRAARRDEGPATSGRGLRLVQAYATGMRVHRSDAGTCVIAQVARVPRAAGDTHPDHQLQPVTAP
jgi:anti-sigma regulatory factor (Ser/Thr protein kinase)